MNINPANLDILFKGYGANFREGFESAPKTHEPFTLNVPSTTREQEYAWLGQFPSLSEWLGERVIRGIVAHGYSIKNRKYEATVKVSRDDIEDDQFGVYAPMFSEMGRAAMDHQSELVFGALKDGFESDCYDGQYFFDTDHPVGDGAVSNDGGGAGTPWFLLDASRMIKPVLFQERMPAQLERLDEADKNYATFMRDEYLYGIRCRDNVGYGLWQLAYGSKEALSVANYQAARQAMMAFKGDNGRPMGIMPTHLVVPPALEDEGLTIVNAMLGAGGASNIYYETAELVVSPWLA